MSQQFQPPAPDSVTPAPGYPAAPAPKGNVVLGIVAAVVAAVAAAAAYGAIIGATEHEIGYAAVGVGILIGFAAGKLGGRNPLLPVVAAVLSLGSVYAGGLVGEAVMGSKQLPISTMELLTQHLDIVMKAWKADADAISLVFFAIGALAAFQTARKTAA
ncbi:hypothetical protein OHS33_21855 [Streptomyces sp. NBC_00536]|uniref:hypothetical protein n=1 Tax=Streptomyces sp. NBC_00536 TaxID=2975769 RepID=UPI002E7FCC59|nr:hypothetical protein [Streptomyces sp. NBC_00536]WUC80738.1 hypothetical protein OHS33_21855 [Streptomyces sp. NBC_00536]